MESPNIADTEKFISEDDLASIAASAYNQLAKLLSNDPSRLTEEEIKALGLLRGTLKLLLKVRNLSEAAERLVEILPAEPEDLWQ